MFRFLQCGSSIQLLCSQVFRCPFCWSSICKSVKRVFRTDAALSFTVSMRKGAVLFTSNTHTINLAIYLTSSAMPLHSIFAVEQGCGPLNPLFNPTLTVSIQSVSMFVFISLATVNIIRHYAYRLQACTLDT